MDRLASTRYRWQEIKLDSKAAKQEAKSTAPGAEYLMLRQRVAQAMDTTGWGTILVMVDVILSVLSVMIYIAMTYTPLDALYHTDLALACVFTLNWVFWFWIAEDRLRYIFSFLTLVDVVTITPSFVLYGLGATVAETVPGLNFLRVLRILRVLRVFRMKHIMRRHLEGAVVEAAGKLVFSLFSIMFIAAGLFFELEKYGPPDDEKKTDNLKFHQSIYWATVTLTTVGYGDIVPTYWATQVMLIGLLMLTFTLLPYLTGQLMDALTSTSTYQRRSFKPSRRADVSHVVITGFLDGATVQGVLDELYHEDKGFNHNHAVLLSERPPSHDVQHVLATHNASRKLTYLQGSPFRAEDFRRAGAEYASAIFIIAPKYPEDPTTADRYLSMCALSLGQYLQEVHVSMEERLSHTPKRVMHWIKHGTVLPPEQLPDVYLQLCLPEGRLRLFEVLQSLQERHSKPKRTASSAAAAATAAGADADSKQAWKKQQQSPAATAGPDEGDDDTALVADDAAAAGECDTLNEMSHMAESASRASSGLDAAACSDGHQTERSGDAAVDLSAYQDAPSAASGKADCQQQWQRQGRRNGWLRWCCAPLSKSNPKRPPLNLTTGTAFWQEYSGSIHVLCLSEVKYAMMAQSVVGVPGAITLLCNLSTTVDFGISNLQQMQALPAWLRDYMVGASQEVYKLHAFPCTLVGRTVKEAAGFVFDSCHAVLLAVERTTGLQQHRLIVGDLAQSITPDMCGFIVADDVSSVLLISAAQQGDFELWHQLRQQRLLEQLAGTSSQQGERKAQKGGETGKVAGMQQSWKRALQTSSSLQLPEGPPSRHRLLPRRQSEPSAVHKTHSGFRQGTTADSSIARQPGVVSEPGTYQDLSGHQRQQQQRQQHVPGAWSSAPTAGDKGVGGSSHSVAAVLTAGSPVGVVTRRVPAGHASALGALIHLLRSPSRVMRKQGEAFLREHYHMRPSGAVQWDKWVDADMSVDLSELSGHILVLGLPASQDGLLSLLAVLRSKRLLQWRPVVIIDNSEPSGGGSWEAVAQFCDVYFIKAGAGLNDALLRASAERAAQAILMTPLVSHDYDDEDHRLASKVMTDAVVVNRYQLLKGLNPSIDLVTEMMMPQSVSFLASTTPVRGVDHRYLHLLSPAYISGSVFHARLLDDLMVASYCNGASDRLVLQLLHRWHMGWAGAQAFSTLAKEQQEILPGQQPMQQQQEPQKQLWQQQQQADVTAAPLTQIAVAAGAAGGTDPAQQQVHQQAHLKSAASAVLNNPSRAATSMKVAEAAAGDLAKRVMEEKRGVPVLMQISVECPPGTTYGRYFHLLLHTRGLLLLGVHRLVTQDGLTFRATITNPSYHSEMQPGDAAFVVGRPPLPTDCSDRSAVAAAWPSDTLGFSNLHPQPPRQQDLWVPAAAAAAAAEGQVGETGAAAAAAGAVAAGAAGDATLLSLADADETSVHAQQAPLISYPRSACLPSNSATSRYDAAPGGTQRTDCDDMSVVKQQGCVESGGPAAGNSMVGVPMPGASAQVGAGQGRRTVLVKTPGVQGAVLHPDAGKKGRG